MQDTEESYPWDSVWEYILNDKNFEELRPKKIAWPKPLRVGRVERDAPSSDSDSAYESEEESARPQRDTEFKQGRAATILAPPSTRSTLADTPKKRFRWLHRRRRQKRNDAAEQTRIAEIPREKFKIHHQQMNDDEQDRRSDVGTPRWTLSAIRHRRDHDDSISTTSSGAKSMPLNCSEFAASSGELMMWRFCAAGSSAP
eukprot:scaffold132_cov170-Amphora_coffeaeformis.AAC.46